MAKNKKIRVWIATLFLVSAFMFGGASMANAQKAADGINPAASLSTQKTTDVCSGASVFSPSTWIECALQGVLQLVGYLFAIAATLFAWSIDPANISGANGILNKQAIKDVWIMVRDLLNLGFILILLFSAFGTIFQLSKWNLKGIYQKILINSLLVNFSFPIARFVIDVSNVAFYYFVDHLFVSTTTITGSSIFASFAASSGIADLLQPANYQKFAIPYLIGTIVFVFIFGMTLLVIAGLFIIRLTALAMLVMASPFGFISYAGYAGRWWKELFNYAFFAPIMIFGMAVSLRIMTAVHDENMGVMMAKGSANAAADQSNWIANAAFFTIPIIVLWSVMGVAKKFSIYGADTVTKKVQSGGQWLANNIQSGAKWAAYGHPVARGLKEGVKEKAKINAFKKWWNDPSSVEAAVKGGIMGVGKDGPMKGARDAWNKNEDKIKKGENQKKIKEVSDDYIDSGKDATFLATAVNTAAHPVARDKKIEHAQAARAYTRLDYNEKKAHLDATLTGARGTAGYGDFDAMLNATAAVHPSLVPGSAAHTNFINERNQARIIADAMKAGRANNKQQDKLLAFINKQMKNKIQDGTNAK